MSKIDDDFKVFSLILEPILREPLFLGRKYCSPLPRKGHYETTASFVVFEGQGKYAGRLFWKDWGLTDQKGSLAEHLLMRIHDITFEQAEEMIEKLDIPEVMEFRRQKKYKLRVEDREEFTDRELAWWQEYSVGEETLIDYNVYGVDRLWAGKKLMYDSANSGPAFTYRGGKDLTEWQFYCPDPKTFWRYGNFIYGWDQLPYTMEDLVIVSGMKDGLVFYEATGMPFIAGSGEGAYKQIGAMLKTLRKRAKRLWTLMDPDAPGQMATRAFMEPEEQWLKELGMTREEVSIPPFPFKYPNDKEDIAALAKSRGLEYLTPKLTTAIESLPFITR